MSLSARFSLFCALTVIATTQTACHMVPQNTLRQSQLRTQQLYGQNKSLAATGAQASQTAQQLAAERQRLAEQNAQLQSNLEVANQRLDNLSSERAQLQQRYVSLLNQAKPSPLSNEATQQFQDLARRYPDFDFDPQTGVSKFHSDILFGSGSAELKSSSHPLLREFAQILNAGDAKRLNILVVGHTDDKPISKGGTKAKHPTNWHLSTNRANSVVLQLSKSGLKENRMGVAGYSMFQPITPNNDDNARQRNRRVEIFVLAPDAVVAGWDKSGKHR